MSHTNLTRKPRLGSFGRSRNCVRRKGGITVETAIIMPFFIMFTFAILQFGHALMIKSVLKNAVRNAARYGTTEEATTAEVMQWVRDGVDTVVDPADVEIFVKDASVFDRAETNPSGDAELLALDDVEVADLEKRTMFMVFARFNYNDAAILRYPMSSEVFFIGRSFVRVE